ncbi:MAG: NUDIX hydrolase, partial [Planctomycetes bacterium]|nr:NUDIX hydrolase [Planctomycetota bacterium]
YWSAVTGSLEAGETQEQACVREAMEEVGLAVQPVRKLWESVTRGAHFVLHWWQCELRGPRTVTPDPKEVGAFEWKARTSLLDAPLMFSDSRHFYREVYEQTRRK